MKKILAILTLSFLNHFLMAKLYSKETSFNWEPIERASYYKIKFCKDESCSQLVYSEDVKVTSYKRKFSPGIYFFTLAPVSETGKVGIWIKPKKFAVSPKVPILVHPKNKTAIMIEEDFSINFTWNKSDGAQSYLLKIVYPNGEEKELRTTNTSFKTDASSLGKYRWGVKSMLDDSTSEGYSDFWEFTLDKRPPEIINIKNNSTVYLQKDPVQIKWSGKGFNNYSINLEYKKDSDSEFAPLKAHQTSENLYNFTSPRVGTYRTTITGSTPNKINLKSKAIVFSIKEKMILKNHLTFNLLRGRPESSRLETDPDYTITDSGEFDKLTTFMFRYERQLGKPQLNLNILQTIAGQKINVSGIQSKIQYGFDFKYLKLSPGIGLNYIKLLHGVTQNSGDLRLTPHSNLMIGLDLRFKIFFLKNSSLIFIVNHGAFSENTQYSDALLKYEYKLNQHFSLNLGLYSFNLDGKWIPKPYNPEEDLNQEKKDVHEGYSAILFGIGIDF